MWTFSGSEIVTGIALKASTSDPGRSSRSSSLRTPPRAILACAILLTCLAIPRAGLSSSELLYQIQEVKSHVFVSIPDDVIDQDCDPQYNRTGTSGFVLTSQGVVVIDTSNSPMNARDLLYEIRRRTEMPIRDVIDTSSAPDHMLGNEVFTDEQATIISTRAAQAEMQQYQQDLLRRFHDEEGWRLQARMRGFHITPSTQTFEGEMSLNIGGEVVRITSIPTDEVAPSDAVVDLPAEKVLFLGDLFDNHYFPGSGHRDIHKWIEALKQIEGWDVDTYVPGHGLPTAARRMWWNFEISSSGLLPRWRCV